MTNWWAFVAGVVVCISRTLIRCVASGVLVRAVHHGDQCHTKIDAQTVHIEEAQEGHEGQNEAT